MPYGVVRIEQGVLYYEIWPAFVKWPRVTDQQFTTKLKTDSGDYFSCALSAAPKSRKFGELLLSMRGKPAEVDNHMGSFAFLRIFFSGLTGMHLSGLASMNHHH